MKFYTSERYAVPLPDDHRFPGGKYQMLRETLLAEGILRQEQLHPSPFAEDADILRVHDEGYMQLFERGELDPQAMRRIGLPWSATLVKRVRATMGGAIAAAEAAMEQGFSGQLSGGTHHAHRDFGSGYCIYNDQAIAALAALAKGWAERVAIIDLDVHQGDGSAAILEGEDRVFVFSIHGARNFPFRKTDSDLDVGLPDDCGDEAYLAALEKHLPAVFDFRPDLILYQCGVDALAEDRLGRLAMTHAGLVARDEIVLGRCRRAGIPVALALGGGYAEPIDASVSAYANTYRVAKSIYGF